MQLTAPASWSAAADLGVVRTADVMDAMPFEHPATTDRPPVPTWISVVGWVSVAGCAAFAAATRYEIATLPQWEIQGGIIDFFLPGPRALAMLLLELGHLWLVVVAVTLVLGKKRACHIRSRDRLLMICLLAGVISGGILFGELEARGVTIGIPGIDHHWGWWF
jgi:hypothetical protein